MRVPPFFGLFVFFPGVSLSSIVTGACPANTDLIMRVNVRTTTTRQTVCPIRIKPHVHCRPFLLFCNQHTRTRNLYHLVIVYDRIYHTPVITVLSLLEGLPGVLSFVMRVKLGGRRGHAGVCNKPRGVITPPHTGRGRGNEGWRHKGV